MNQSKPSNDDRRNVPAVLDVDEFKPFMTDEGYVKFLDILKKVGTADENTLVMLNDKPIFVFIPAWKVSKAIDGLALEGP